MPDPITCVLIDDHAVVREGLRLRLESDGNIKVIGEAEDGSQGLEVIRRETPDVALVDIRLPIIDGMGVARAVRDEGLKTKLIMFSSLSDRTLIDQLLEIGVDGYVAKEARLDVVVSAIGTVLAGRRFIDPSVAAELLHQQGQSLSKREHRILQLMADGHTNSEIAKELNIADETVKTHISAILRKLEVSGRTGAVAEAFRRQLVN